MGRLEGKNALVTGAARGLGFAIATKLCEEGARVILSDVMEDSVAAAAKELTDKGFRADYVVGDVSKYEEVQKMVDDIVAKYEQIHILVNNAGINRDAIMHKMSHEDWDKVIAIDLTGVFYCTQAVGIHMREKGYGRIVSISSAAKMGNVGQANYSAAKAGVIGFTKACAKEFARKNITMNTVSPGFIDTDMTRKMPQDVLAKFLEKVPLGRMGQPSDVANAVCFLVSDEASYITAEDIEVMGGFRS